MNDTLIVKVLDGGGDGVDEVSSVSVRNEKGEISSRERVNALIVGRSTNRS